jgi:outer membrane protein OmpA-like peptidoglycan-associated protein
MKVVVLLFVLLAGGMAFGQKAPDPFKKVNSVYDEQSPVLTPDGKALYFTVANNPQNVGGKKDAGDIWVSLWIGDTWTAPINAGTYLNDPAYNAVAGFSPDGNQLFLLSHYGKNGAIATTQGIAVSEKTSSGWSTPKNIAIPYFMNKSAVLSGMLNKEGNVFVFAAESYNTFGAEDIYVAIKKGDQWGEAIHLGKTINSASQEISPSLSEDEKTLYFASNGRKGLGSFDIYATERLDDTWTNWSTPVNMGAPVNSDARELYFRTYYQKNISLFTSTRNSDGYGDIRSIVDSLRLQPKDTVVKIVEVKHEVNSDKTIVISGKVTNSKTNEPIVAQLTFRADSSYTASTQNSGGYKIKVPSTKVYSIEVMAKGYVNVVEKLDIHTFEMKTLEMSFKLQPVEVGTLVNLKNVLFYMGTTSLLEESYPELDAVVDFLKSNPKVEIELEGHTDNRGDVKKNVVLSQQRVDRIKTYLVTKGISGKRIKGKGFGGSRPIANSDSEEARRLNRRVEFLIVKN